MPIAAVIFDMDGVLIDSEPFWQESEIDAFGRAGLHLERADCRRTMGMRVDEVVAYWAAGRPWSDREQRRLAEAILDGVIERVRDRGQPLPGVGTALREVERRGYRLGLASSSPRRVIRAILDTLDLADAFRVAVSAESERRGKPAPDVYLTACRALGAQPARSVAVEDSLAGMRSAHSAGLRCVLVPDPSLRGREEIHEADLLLDSLQALDRAAWRRLDALDPIPSGAEP